MCKMLLSINPEHVENILCGKKRFEFRKVCCKADVDKIIIYSTAPVMRVVAEKRKPLHISYAMSSGILNPKHCPI